jgi:hypothetical protein
MTRFVNPFTLSINFFVAVEFTSEVIPKKNSSGSDSEVAIQKINTGEARKTQTNKTKSNNRPALSLKKNTTLRFLIKYIIKPYKKHIPSTKMRTQSNPQSTIITGSQNLI